jgi:hypothetical protein
MKAPFTEGYHPEIITHVYVTENCNYISWLLNLDVWPCKTQYSDSIYIIKRRKFEGWTENLVIFVKTSSQSGD